MQVEPNNDGSSNPRLTEISQLDKLPWDAKMAHVLKVAQPFGKTPGPWFPLETLEESASLIVAAARHAVALCGLDGKNKIHKTRDPKAIQAWIDTWTHPGIYQQVFQDWIGQVYVNRTDTQYVSQKAEEDWHQNPQVQGPIWHVNNAEHRGVPDLELSRRIKKEFKYDSIPDSIDLTGLAGSTKPYQHAWPERYGHATHLVPWKQSAIARAILGQDLPKAYDILKNKELPASVVRLVDISWYLAGFLGSVLIWTHLALEVAKKIRGLSGHRGMMTSVDLGQLVTSASVFFARGSVLYSYAWLGLVQQLKHIPKSRLCIPFPDMIRMPQEWCAVMSERKPLNMDILKIIGLPGNRRRSMSTNFPIQKLNTTTTTTTTDKEEVLRDLQAQLISRSLQEIHMAELSEARFSNVIPRRYFNIVERYLPMPDPPHPVAALFLPWTSIYTNVGKDHQSKHGVERVNRLASLAMIHCQWICIPCMETGLALEEWGRTWTPEALTVLTREEPWSAKFVMKTLNSGAHVPLWDMGAMPKKLILESVQNLDPNGPMGDGYRFYTADAALYGAESAWPRSKTVLDTQSWLRLERMTTTEYLSLSGPEQSLVHHSTRVGVWEDSGLELSSFFIRKQQRHMPLLQCAINIMPSVAGREAARQKTRYWQLKFFDPWPVHSDFQMVDLSQVSRLSLRRALVIRTLALKQVIFPHRHWFRNLLTYLPPPVKTGTDHGLRPSVPDILTRSARLSLTHLEVSMLSLSQPGSIVGWPTTRPEKEQFAEDILPINNSFKHYPNLRIINLSHLKLGKIPAGFLSLAVNTDRRLPMGKSAAIHMPSALLACRLDHNAIEALDDQSLLALVQFIQKHLLFGTFTSDLWRPPGNFVSTRLPIYLRINLGHNPIAQHVQKYHHGHLKDYLGVRSAHLLRFVVTVNDDDDDDDDKTDPNETGEAEDKQQKPLSLLQWWKKYEVLVNLYLDSMLVFKSPKEFDVLVRHKFGSLMQHRWI